MRFTATLFVNDRPVATVETNPDGSAEIVVPRGVNGHKDNSCVIVRDERRRMVRMIQPDGIFATGDTVNVPALSLA